ncbi:hypothetical protein [Stieleria varia]|uniref:hypothetical protein n=1 Tax=Stieleria varia TaxID=2528005 RepID=UPI0018D26D46|nr:hypothetical protein [Stieleria varia]
MAVCLIRSKPSIGSHLLPALANWTGWNEQQHYNSEYMANGVRAGFVTRADSSSAGIWQ